MRRASFRLLTIAALIALPATQALAQSFNNYNFVDRKAAVLQVSPYVELSDFKFGNSDESRGRQRFVEQMRWKNIGTQPIVAIDITILKYDAFDQRLLGTRMVVTGTDSANWKPLAPGETGSDGALGYTTEAVYTAVAYVRQVRLADGTVWRADETKVLSELKKVVASIRDPGSLRPDPKPAATKSE